MDPNEKVTKNPNGLNAVVERAVHDNWGAYDQWDKNTRRKALTAAIVLAHPTFDHGAVFGLVKHWTNSRKEDVKPVREKKTKKKTKTKTEEILFEVDGREFTRQEILGFLATRETGLPQVKKESGVASQEPPQVCYSLVWVGMVDNPFFFFSVFLARHRLSLKELLSFQSQR